VRRVHNKFSIKPTDNHSDPINDLKQSNQSTKNATAVSRKRWLIEAVFILLVVVVPISVQAVFWNKENSSLVEEPIYWSGVTTSPLDISVLSAEQNPNQHGARGGAEVLVEDGALVSVGPVGANVIASAKGSTGEIRVYTVRAGDTLSHIAEMYDVTANTILWANDLPRASSIKEGQVLVILPIVGVSHVVKKGDTVKVIAKTYDGDIDEILTYNQLSIDDALVIGSNIVVPGGAIHTAPVTKLAATPTRTSGGGVSGAAWLSHPAPGSIKTQGLHGYNAVDFAGSIGSPVRAAASGEVIVSKSSGWNGGYGQYIVIRHSNGAQTLYAHLIRNDIGVGANVSQGAVIGGVGNTGRSTGPHLHFEVRGASNPF